MTFTSIAVGGVAKTLMAVTISLHPGAAKQAGDYTVKAGDTLSSISQHEYGTAADWPALWWINRGTVRDPDMIQTGQRLRVSGRPAVTGAMLRAALAARPVAVAPAPAADPAPAASSAPAEAPESSSASYSGAPGSFQACVVQAESGGNASAVNPSSGAGGLYQFLPSTWQALGFSGLPQDASVAEQNAAFQKEYAESGTSAWSAYDGC
jgi:resuscitation-promoting factor RpfC